MPHPINPVRQFIDAEFPDNLRRLIPPALRRAYGAVDALMDRVEFLSTPSGRYQRGDLIMKATEHAIYKLVEAGSLPLEADWEDYALPTGKHLVLRSSRARITINQVSAPDEKPRRAIFRRNFGLGNMESLFPEWNEEARQEESRRHLLLLHGYQALSFANIAYPHPTKHRLVWWTDNLLKVPHAADAADIQSTAEGPTDSPDPEIMDDLQRFLRDGK